MLIDDIVFMDLLTGVENSLTGPLNQVVNVLTDDNPNNDGAVCGELNAFIIQVNLKEAIDQLTAEEADQLRQSAEAILAALLCL